MTPLEIAMKALILIAEYPKERATESSAVALRAFARLALKDIIGVADPTIKESLQVGKAAQPVGEAVAPVDHIIRMLADLRDYRDQSSGPIRRDFNLACDRLDVLISFLHRDSGKTMAPPVAQDQDAARYRFIRDCKTDATSAVKAAVCRYNGNEFDAAIDAAIAAHTKEEN